MKRKEALEILKENLCSMCAYGSQSMKSCDIRCCDNRDAIKVLEQDSLLNKIRADVEALPKTYPFVNHIDMYVKEDDVKKIIDKYKTESEINNKGIVIGRNLCESCVNTGCIFQTGVFRKHCEFYKAESEDKE